MVVLVFTYQEFGTKMFLTESTTRAKRKVSKAISYHLDWDVIATRQSRMYEKVVR